MRIYLPNLSPALIHYQYQSMGTQQGLWYPRKSLDFLINLCGANTARLTDHEGRLWAELVIEVFGPCADHAHAPDFAHDVNAVGNGDRAGDDICAMIDVGDLACSNRIQVRLHA